MRYVFFGSGGVRAGWRLLAFILLAALPIALLVAIVLAFAPRNAEIGFPHLVGGIADPIELAEVEGIILLSVTFATALMAKFEHRAFGSYGVPWRLAFGKAFWEGTLWGFVAISFAIAIIVVGGGGHIDGLAQQSATAILEAALLWAFASVIVGLAEESLFRGYVQHTLGSSIGFWPAAAIVSLLFLSYHLANAGETAVGLTGIVAFGLFFCLTLWLTGNLWFAIGFHAAWDWGQSFFYGVPNSGLSASDNFLRTSAAGPQWLSGGTAGPEASIACLITLAAASALLWRRYRRV